MNKDTNIDLYGVIGHPVSHSLSPFLMNRVFRQIDLGAVYLRFDVEPGEFDRAVAGLSTLGARGANVTYPYKEDAFRIADVPTPEASLIGAVNTLVFQSGKIVGVNTDAEGAASALRIFGGISLRNKRIFIYGGGGSARAAAVGLLRHGAAAVTFGLRSPDKNTEIFDSIREFYPGQSLKIVPIADTAALDDYRYDFTLADVVINATPVGMGSDKQSTPLADPSWIRSDQCFFDFVYYPGRTCFLDDALKQGATALGGVSLLVCQAVESFNQWTGQTFDARSMQEALEAAFPERTV
jgi:shikimate dehydrogenase